MMWRSFLRATSSLLLGIGLLNPVNVQALEDELGDSLLIDADALKPWFGDFDGMRERRVVRVLVVPNMTMWFYDDGKPHGLAFEALRAFEEHLNKKHKPAKKNLKLLIAILPTTRDQLIPKLLAGEADLAVASLTITPGWLEQVDFSDPFVRDIAEIAVTGPSGPDLDLL